MGKTKITDYSCAAELYCHWQDNEESNHGGSSYSQHNEEHGYRNCFNIKESDEGERIMDGRNKEKDERQNEKNFLA
jgi:hypothetical protein